MQKISQEKIVCTYFNYTFPIDGGILDSLPRYCRRSSDTARVSEGGYRNRIESLSLAEYLIDPVATTAARDRVRS